MGFLISLLVNGLIIYLASGLLSGVTVSSYFEAIVVALLLTIVNALVKPLVYALSLPVSLTFLGILLIVVNAGILLFVDWFLDGFNINGWFWAIVLAIILGIFNLFSNGFSVGMRRPYYTRERL